jgi:hypothetical protein
MQEELIMQLKRTTIYTDMIVSDLEALVKQSKLQIIVFGNGGKYVSLV